ncbi:hypothetical protein GCM10027299_52350 [Larkinella ripae]
MHQTWITIPVTIDEMRQMWREDMRLVMKAGLAEQMSSPTTSENLPDFLTRKEAAQLFRVSLVTLHDWSRDIQDRPAIITPIRINGRVRYKRDEVLALLSISPKYRRRI